VYISKSYTIPSTSALVKTLIPHLWGLFFIYRFMPCLPLKGIICSVTECFSSCSTFKQFARTLSSTGQTLNKGSRSVPYSIKCVETARILANLSASYWHYCSCGLSPKMVKSFSSHYTCTWLIASACLPIHTIGWHLYYSHQHMQSNELLYFSCCSFHQKDILLSCIQIGFMSHQLKHWFVHELIEIPP